MEYIVAASDLASIRWKEESRVREILRNVAMILATPKGSLPLYREFGLDMSFLDKPMNEAKNAAVIPIREAIEEWEPRAEYRGIILTADVSNPGKLTFAVRIEIKGRRRGMNEGTEYKFIPTSPEDVVSWLTAIYEETMDVTVRPASPERQLIQWIGSAIVMERVMTNYAANQNIPSRAVGANLDALAELFSTQKRPEAKAATCTMRFTISEPQAFNLLAPKGTRVTDKNQSMVWETLEDVQIKAGESYADVKIQCQTPGTQGNGYVQGQINSIIDPFAYFFSCENITESDGGADEATDEEFYELLRLSMDGYSSAGAKGSYIYWAKQVSTEIADVAVNSPTPGVVKLYVLMDDGTIAGKEIKEKVLAACSADEKRPLTDQVSVEDAEVVPYDISFTYYLQSGRSKSAAETAAAVQEAVERYQAWQCAKLGRDINPDELREYLYHTGIKRIELTSPAFTVLRDGSGKTVPQVAAVGQVTITNGGYEDE